MTIVAGLEYNGNIYVGSDSAASDESIIDIVDRPKFFIKQNIVIGYCGTFRIGQILEQHLSLSKIQRTEKWLLKNFPGLVRRTLEKNGASDDKDWDLLVGFNQKIYVMQADYSIIRSKNGFSAIGDGQAYAYGSLHSTRAVDDPIKRINLALEAASTYSMKCAPPFHVVEL